MTAIEAPVPMDPLDDDERRPSLLVVQPDELVPLERFEQWLEDEGLSVTVVRPFLGEQVPARLGHDGVLVLGGDMGAHDLETYPYLQDIIDLLIDAIEQERPVLGLCLGGQLLAVACGGVVEPGDRGLEAGAVPLSLRDEAMDDEVFASLPVSVRMGSCHRDAIVRLPHDAVWLMESEMYPHQAFRVGGSAWGVQFHPELSPTRYQSWVDAISEEDAISRGRLEVGVDTMRRFDEQVRDAARQIAAGFAAVVRRD